MMHEKTERDKDCREYKDLIKRLNRIEGQVRGLKRMLGYPDSGQCHQQWAQCV